MSDIEQRIADVLRKHQVTPTGEVPGEVECSCGQLCKTWDHGDDHLASVLVAELGLTEEVQQHPKAKRLRHGGWEDIPISHRYVTAWERAE